MTRAAENEIVIRPEYDETGRAIMKLTLRSVIKMAGEVTVCG